MTKEISSGVLILLGGFLIFYAYYMWIGYYGAKFLRFWLNPLDQLLPLYYVVGFISFALALIIIYKAMNTEVSKLAKGILFGSLIVFGGYLISEAYHLLIGYYEAEFFGFRFTPLYQWMPLYFVVGFVSFALGLIMTYKVVNTQISKLAKRILSAIFIITGSFSIFDAYHISVKYHQVKDIVEKHPVPSLYYQYFRGLRLAYQWLPLYIAVALISIASGLIIAYKTSKTLKTQPSTPSRTGNILLLDRNS